MSQDNKLAVKNEELLALYQNDVDAGIEDAGTSGKLPQLKITHPMALTKDKDAYLLADGGKAEMGMIYHTELKQEFEQIATNITYIGQFNLPEYNKPENIKMNYVLGGIMKADQSPFIVFVKGMSLQSVWDFMGEVSAIRSRFKLPMYSLTVHLKVGSRPSDKYGEVSVWKFDIVRDKNGVPEIEGDIGRANFLKDTIPMFKEKIQQVLQQESETDPYLDQANDEDVKNVKEAMGE